MPPRASIPAINGVDRRRYRLFRDGMSAAEIATRDRATLAQVEKSILKCRDERQMYSQEAVEIAVRKTVLEKLPEAAQVISEAAKATKYEGVKVLVEDPDTGRKAVMDDSLEVPDHTTRLKAHSALIELISSIKVPVPLSQVNVDARSLTQNNLGLPAQTGQPSSAEAVIREIRAARGLALTDGATTEQEGNAPPMIEVDTELAEELEEDGEDEESEEDDGGDDSEDA